MNDVAVFVRVVDAGGFSAAARKLGLPKSSVSRQIARLERALGVRLLQRTTRSFSLTEPGRAYHGRAAAALAAMRAATCAAVEEQEVPRGTLRISAPPDLRGGVLPELVARFVAAHPEVRVEVDLSVRMVDLVEEGYDLAIRGGALKDSSLVARKLQDTEFRLFAAPGYLDREGRPRRPADLARHDCVLFRPRDGKCRWVLRGPRQEVAVMVRGPVAADDLLFVQRAAVAGAGVALLPEFGAHPHVREGALVPVLPDHCAPGAALHIVYPSTRHLSRKVVAFRDFLVEHYPRMMATLT